VEALEIRERDATELWLLAGLGMMRLAAPSIEEIARVAPAVLAALDEVPWMPPAGVVADVARLLAGGRASFAAPLVPAGAARLRAALRAYEDEWLGRLAAEARLDAAADAFAALPAELRPRAIAVVVSSVLARTGFAAGAMVSAGAARRLLARPPAEILARVQAALQRPTEVLAQLAHGYEGLVHAARKAPRLLDDADVFAIEHLAVLGSATQRLAIAQVLDAAAELGRAMPRSRKPKRATRGLSPTRLEDESAYPAGGFAALTTSGSLENLVSSEVVYMEDGPEMDLFDVRYVEGELLFYTRDEAVHVRPRRAIAWLLDPSLAALRFKDPELPFQRVVVLLGLVVCLVRRLFEWLNDEDLAVRVVFLREPHRGPALAPERGLTDLLLREWIAKGAAEVLDATADEAARALVLDAKRAHVQAVYIGPPERATAFQDGVAEAAHASLDAAAIGAEWASWVRAMIALADAIV
jgi:hypothetical protein